MNLRFHLDRRWLYTLLLPALSGCVSAGYDHRTTTEEWDNSCPPEQREVAPAQGDARPTLHDGLPASAPTYTPARGGTFKGKRTTTETRSRYSDTREAGAALNSIAGFMAPEGMGGLVLQALGTGGAATVTGGLGGLVLLIGKLWRDSAARKVALKAQAEKHAAEAAAWDEAARVYSPPPPRHSPQEPAR